MNEWYKRYISDKYYNQCTPIEIAEAMVDTIPANKFNASTKFLNMYCKDGVFLIAIRNKLMKTKELIDIFPDPKERRKHIEKNQLYGLCWDKSFYEPSLCNIYETVLVKNPNIKLFEYNPKTLLRENKNLFKDKLKETFGEMKFDIVIGNPPYNNDIYLDFVTAGHELAKECSVWITPAKWQAKGGEKNEAFRENIVPYMKKIVYYPDCIDIFAIQESSGITYYLIDKDKHEKCEIINRSAMKPCIDSTETRSIINEESLWNCGNSVVNKIKQSNDYKQYWLREVVDRKKYTININKQMTKATGTSGCWDWDNSCIKQSWIGKGGVLFTSEGTIILPTPKLITESQDNSSGTSIDVFTTDDIDEAKSFVSWTFTKFIRFLLMINIGSLTIMNERGWRFVPDPGPFDHIFTDEELYKKYNLTQEEINIIESVIKER